MTETLEVINSVIKKNDNNMVFMNGKSIGHPVLPVWIYKINAVSVHQDARRFFHCIWYVDLKIFMVNGQSNIKEEQIGVICPPDTKTYYGTVIIKISSVISVILRPQDKGEFLKNCTRR